MNLSNVFVTEKQKGLVKFMCKEIIPIERASAQAVKETPVYLEINDVTIGCANEDGELLLKIRRTETNVTLHEAREIAAALLNYVNIQELC